MANAAMAGAVQRDGVGFMACSCCAMAVADFNEGYGKPEAR